MEVTPETLLLAEKIGRAERRRNAREQRRQAIAHFVDTGMMPDDDVRLLYEAYVSGREAPPEEER